MYRFSECRALGIASSETELPVEEESVSDDLDLDKVNDELQAMKTHITKLQGMLFINVDACPDKDPCLDLETELNCSKNTEICTLQRSNYKLQMQICDIMQCCQLVKEQLRDLHARHCIEMRQLQRFQKMLDEFNAFKLQLEHKFALCLERFEYLKHVKCEWSDLVDNMCMLKERFNYFSKCMVPHQCFVREKKAFIMKINELRAICQGLHAMFSNQIAAIEERLNQISPKSGLETSTIRSVSMELTNQNDAGLMNSFSIQRD